MRLLYTKRITGLPEGFSIRNPDYFLKPENGVEHVTIEGKYPAIVEAYEKEGVLVEVAGKKAAEAVAVPESVVSDADKAEAEVVELGQSTVKELSDMSVDELKAYLAELGVEFTAKATKQQLLELAKEG